VKVALMRGAGFCVLWLILVQSSHADDLVMGAFTAIAATWLSLRLIPPASVHLRVWGLVSLFPHFLQVSILAGVDVARRAFDPRMPLQTGFVNCPLGFPPGLTRNTFATITSLMPGVASVGETESVLIYHCLDTSQSVVDKLWEQERLLAWALNAGRRDE
jgi:multicomponent Na+:H+ antiporter subunit E